VHFETRLAIIFLAAAGADGSISEEEMEQIAAHLTPVLEQVGGNQNVRGVLKHARRVAGDPSILKESIDLLGEYLPAETLASIAGELQEIASADGMSDEEQELVDAVIERWQIEPGDGDGEEGDDEEGDEGEEGEGDDDDEEGEGDEGEEGEGDDDDEEDP
jgi:uncharacterized tellurite resistance protein B-like protein